MTNCNPPCAASQMHMHYGHADNSPRHNTDCDCHRSRFPANTSYAMAYVPFQQSGDVYACDKALARGTIFPCLDLPFLKGCCK